MRTPINWLKDFTDIDEVLFHAIRFIQEGTMRILPIVRRMADHSDFSRYLL